MKKTIIALMALAGVASASLNYGDAAFQANNELKNGVVVSYDFNAGGTSYVADSSLQWYGWINNGNNSTTFTTTTNGYADLSANGGVYSNVLGNSFNTGSFTISFDLISTSKNTNYGSILTLYSGNAGYGAGWNKSLSIRNDGSDSTSLILGLCAPNADQEGFDGRIEGTKIATGISSTTSTPTTITIVSAAAEEGAQYGILTLYINGAKKGEITNWNAKDLTGICFGDIFGGNNKPGQTLIDNLTIWNTALSSDAVAAAAIPEPATATLSLLALCGLAARRRRK